MCEPSPGPRCAAHVGKELAEARKAVADAQRVLAAARGETADVEHRAWQEQSRIRVDLAVAEQDVTRARDEVRRLVRAYDATGTGLRKLADRLTEAEANGDDATTRRLRIRLSVAQQRHDAVQARWQASATYAGQRMTATTGSARAEWRGTYLQRRWAESGQPPRPTHPRAAEAWRYAEPAGRAWSSLVDAGVDEDDADLTCMDAQVQQARSLEERLSAHYRALPAGYDTTLQAATFRRTAAKPLQVDVDDLRDRVSSEGIEGDGPDGQPGWRHIRVGCSLDVTRPGGAVSAPPGRVWVRDRDGQWRHEGAVSTR